MRINIYPFVIAILILAFTACKKNTPVPIKSKTDTTKTDTTKKDTSKTDTSKKDTSNVDVYVAGTSSGIATYWKNGVPVHLGPGEASAIVINNGDVYVAGDYTAANKASIAAYWKNGIITKLADSSNSSLLKSICIQGTDVYAGGVMDINGSAISAAYWKNGVPHKLPGLQTVLSIAVNNGDVYAAGNGGYFKNDVFVKLSGGNDYGSTAFSIAIDGNDVYASGTASVQYKTGENTINYNVVATYWKNGAYTYLSDTTNQSFVFASTTQNHTLVFAGYSATPGKVLAAYWENNIKTLLVDTSINYSQATGIATYGNDIYITGEYLKDNSDGLTSTTYNGYWKNGVMHTLGGGVSAIAVVPHKN
jgi:hypothetical protein